jgi:hypothetical protein
MLVFLVCVELSCEAQAPYRMKHSECTFRVFDFGDHKSQVHRATHVHRVREPGARLLLYSRKEIVATAAVIAAGRSLYPRTALRPRFTCFSEGNPLRRLLLRVKGGLAGEFVLVFHGMPPL